MADNTPDKDAREGSGLVRVLGEIVRRLKSQPLVFALGTLLLLVIAASLASNALSALTTPALVIFIGAMLVWLVSEFSRAKAAFASKRQGGSVTVNARSVKGKGEVVGIEGLPASKAAPSDVTVKAEHIEGRVGGVRYAKEEQAKNEHESD